MTDSQDFPANKERLENERNEAMGILKRAVECAGDLVLVYDKDWNVLYWSPSVEGLTGYSAEEIARGDAFMFTPPQGRAFLRVRFRRIFQGEVVQDPMGWYRKKDGSLVRVRSTVSPIKDADGDVIACLVLAQDITEQVRLEEEFKYLKEYLENFMDSTPYGVCSFDENLRVQNWNYALQKGTGISKEDVLGMHISELAGLLSYSGKEGLTKRFQGVLDTGSGYAIAESRVTFRRPGSGEQHSRVLNLHTAPIKNRRGETDGMLCITEDVTKSVKLEQQLIHSARLASLGQLAAGVAHEINNPLSALSGTVQMLMERYRGEDGLYEQLKVLRKLAGRIDKTVDGLLRFSKQKAGQKEWFDISKVIENTVSLVQTHFTGNHIRLKSDYAINLPKVYGVPADLQQVVMNLILNAQDAMPKGGLLRISTALTDDGSAVGASVEDTGCGIAEEDIERIFTPFFSTKGPGKGTGLGLAISHGIVSRHGGTITVESELGSGSRFVVTLPLRGAT